MQNNAHKLDIRWAEHAQKAFCMLCIVHAVSITHDRSIFVIVPSIRGSINLDVSKLKIMTQNFKKNQHFLQMHSNKVQVLKISDIKMAKML